MSLRKALPPGRLIYLVLSDVLYLNQHTPVPKGSEYPSQPIINRLKVPLCFGARARYRPEDVQVLTTRYFKMVKKLLDDGLDLERVYTLRLRISYEVHKQWHEERFVTRFVSSNTSD